MFKPFCPKLAITGIIMIGLLGAALASPPTSQAAALTVKKGDLMWSVAETYKASVLTILKIDRDQGNLLVPSQLLFAVERPAVQAKPSRGAADDVISIARRFIGIPYSYGGNGPRSFDCSGFVRYVYASYGIDLPRVASDQARMGRRVTKLAPGDLVFFSGSMNGYITHVGIYIGNNSFIHASTSLGVTITSLDETWYRKRYVAACRVL